MSSATARAACCLLTLSLCAAGAGCTGTSQGKPVTVLVPWSLGTGEYNAFQSVIRMFERETGVQVSTEVSRAATQQLNADLAAGDPPDLVDLPSPGAVYQFEGKGLKPLSIDLSSYDQPWRGLAESGIGTVYAVPVKADVKSLIWYDTRVLQSPPKTWAALENISRNGTPWCLGLASGSASGWPGADWVAEILLSRYQAGTYKDWLDGELPWTSTQVRNAWTTWGTLMRHGAAINGGALGALRTKFGAAASGMASRKCELEHGALSATGLAPATGYDYVPFPSISGAASPILVSGDFMGLFTDNPNAGKLLAYLASRQAQTQWVEQPGGHAFSADQTVTPAAYPAGVEQKIAKLFQPAGSTTLCFGADDMMPPDMSTAFEQAVLYYVNNHNYVNNHTFLQKLLAGMQKTQEGAHPSPLAQRACAKP